MDKHRKDILTGLLILLLFSMFLNLPYIHMREFQGEEGRRVIIAQEMLRSGDYIVPKVEGETYLNKPPLYNWYLVLILKVSGSISEFTTRLSSVITAFLTSVILSIFWMRVSGVRSIWFILPGIIFLTLPEVLDKSIKAEIDMTFTFFITISILSWFYLFEIKGKRFLAWSISLSFLSLGTLAKGVQAPLFFYCGVVPYLFYKKRFRDIFSFNHLGGIAVYLFIFILWFLPLIQRVEFNKVAYAWWREIIVRGEPLRSGGFLRHIIEFPLQYVLSYMPWILFLLLWKKEKLNDRLNDLALYSFLFLLFSLPVYWLIPGARLRYLLPLSGLLVILITIILHSAISNGLEEDRWFSRFKFISGICITLGGLSIPFFIYHYRIQVNPVMVVTGILFLLTGIIFLRARLSIKMVLFFVVFSMFLIKTLWAFIYFPYHQDKHSYYRDAARWINSIATSGKMIYDYKTGNPHLTFYLKRKVIAINKITDFIEEGAFIMTRKEFINELNVKRLLYMGEIKARRMVIVLFRVEKHGYETKR